MTELPNTPPALVPANWLPEHVGSFMAVQPDGYATVEELLRRSWTGLVVDSDVFGIAQLRQQHAAILNQQLLTLCAALDLQGRRFVPDQKAGDLAAGIHPSELYPFFTGETPPLALPRVALVAGPDAFKVLQTLTQWVEGVLAFKLTVNSLEEAREAGQWLSAGWKVAASQELTVWARRLLA